MTTLKLTLFTIILASSSQAQEYIGVKTTNKGDCRLYRERFVVDSGKFSNDLKKQVSYREKLIESGREKLKVKKVITNSMIAVEQVEDSTQGSNLIWAFEYCVYDKPVDDLDSHVVGTTGVAQKVFGNPDGTFTIEYPRILHAGQVYYLESPNFIDGNINQRKFFKSLCSRFSFKKYVSHNDIQTHDSNTVKLNRSGTVSSISTRGYLAILHQLTCK